MTYEESTNINFSKLSALLQGVDYFKKITTEDIFGDSSLSFGSAAHHYFLEYESFFDTYIVFNDNKPSHAMHKDYCTLLSECDTIDKDTRLECYGKVFSIKGKKEDKLDDEATKLYIRYKDYIDFLKQAKNKLILDGKDYEKIQKFEHKFKSHKGICKLLYNNPSASHSFNELPIFFKYKGIDCKAKLDRLVIDQVNKIVYLIDLKTHSTENLRTNIRKSFKESMFKYNYHMQQAIYSIAAKSFIKETLEIDIDGYTFKHMFIVMHSNFTNGVKLFEITEDALYEGLLMFKEALDLYTFHNKNGYDHDVDYYHNELGIEYMT